MGVVRGGRVREVVVGDRVVIRGWVADLGMGAAGGLVLISTGPGLLDGAWVPVSALVLDCPCLRLPELGEGVVSC